MDKQHSAYVVRTNWTKKLSNIRILFFISFRERTKSVCEIYRSFCVKKVFRHKRKNYATSKPDWRGQDRWAIFDFTGSPRYTSRQYLSFQFTSLLDCFPKFSVIKRPCILRNTWQISIFFDIRHFLYHLYVSISIKAQNGLETNTINIEDFKLNYFKTLEQKLLRFIILFTICGSYYMDPH